MQSQLAGGVFLFDWLIVDLLHVDRHLLHDLSGARALSEVRGKGHQVHSPQLALSTPDHTLSTAAGRDENSTENSRRLAALLRGDEARHIHALRPLRLAVFSRPPCAVSPTNVLCTRPILL